MKLHINVKPRSKVECIEKISEFEYVVKVNAMPVDGAANIRVIELLSEYFACSKSKVRLLKGTKSKKKIFEIID